MMSEFVCFPGQHLLWVGFRTATGGVLLVETSSLGLRIGCDAKCARRFLHRSYGNGLRSQLEVHGGTTVFKLVHRVPRWLRCVSPVPRHVVSKCEESGKDKWSCPGRFLICQETVASNPKIRQRLQILAITARHWVFITALEPYPIVSSGIRMNLLHHGAVYQERPMNPNKPVGLKFLHQIRNRFPQQVRRRSLQEQYVIPLGVNGDDLERIDKNNSSLCLDGNSWRAGSRRVLNNWKSAKHFDCPWSGVLCAAFQSLLPLPLLTWPKHRDSLSPNCYPAPLLALGGRLEFHRHTALPS